MIHLALTPKAANHLLLTLTGHDTQQRADLTEAIVTELQSQLGKERDIISDAADTAAKNAAKAAREALGA